MFNKIKIKLKKNAEVVALAALIIVTIISTSFYNYNKKIIYNNYKNTINNVYFKKTISHLFKNLEPKFKKIDHKISNGETFDNILKQYSINEKEISNLKKKLSKKININQLKTNQQIQLIIDQKNNLVKEFIFKISNTEKIYLTRDLETNDFNQKILITSLNKTILYKENIILESLYKSAIQQKIPPNIIVEFARVYGFQVDFQRDIRKRDSCQVMYEVFIDDNKIVIETGNILYANLILSGENNSLYYFDKRKWRTLW